MEVGKLLSCFVYLSPEYGSPLTSTPLTFHTTLPPPLPPPKSMSIWCLTPTTTSDGSRPSISTTSALTIPFAFYLISSASVLPVQAFFQRWWRQQSDTLKAKVKHLVNSGQLEFMYSSLPPLSFSLFVFLPTLLFTVRLFYDSKWGMCMHDEATPHYIDLIDQTTLGHRFILDEFSKKPRVGWQIDPFGHSAVQAYLLGAEVIIAYNPLGWRRVEVIRIPVSSENLVVLDSTGREIESQLLPLSNVSLLNVNYHIKAYLGISASSSARYWLAFSVSVPPLGFSTYVVSSAKQTESRSIISTVYTPEGGVDKTLEVGQGNLKLLYSVNEGKLKRYTNRRNSVAEIAEHSYSYYTGYNGTDRVFQASGAYVFRPNETFPIKTEGRVPLTVIRGPLLDEVHQQLNTWLYQLITKYMQVTRVYKGKEHALKLSLLEPEELLNLISLYEYASYLSDFAKFGSLQIRDYRADWDLEVHQPIAGNYYPINLGIYLVDETTEVSVLVDRAVGGSSLVDGQIELMLHRRLLNDDSRGVGEALNEEVCILDNCKGLTVQGKFYLRIDPRGEGAKWRRTFGQEAYSPLLLAFSQEEGSNWINSRITTFSAIDKSYSLPDNIAVITLQELQIGRVLLRLAHLYEPISLYCVLGMAKTGEDKDYSVVTGVELKKLFPDKKIIKITEMSLSANQERMEMEKKRLDWKVEGAPEEGKVVRGGPVDPVKLVVELAPMEIRTFIIDLSYLKVFGS
ncbi:UNVERIFIED_CONTAM: Alpha-mannosidase [Sesamum radiatum]|uniref:Alpha-mannosidase n=1 Tax=Sesamum radiatum TaxID=300843 RepID=A0AAW2RAL3_SESRA